MRTETLFLIAVTILFLQSCSDVDYYQALLQRHGCIPTGGTVRVVYDADMHLAGGRILLGISGMTRSHWEWLVTNSESAAGPSPSLIGMLRKASVPAPQTNVVVLYRDLENGGGAELYHASPTVTYIEVISF